MIILKYAPWPIARACHEYLTCLLLDLEKPANKLPTTEKGKGACVVRAGPKEDLEEDSRGHVIGDRDRCRGIEGLCWVEVTHHQCLQQGLQGGGCEGLPPERSSSFTYQ